jgi:hypothetical protein
VTAESERHPQKHSGDNLQTEEGIQIEESDEHPLNVARSIHERREPGSNATATSDWHPAKQLRPSVLTEAGIQIDESDKQNKNAASSMHDRREADSNVTVERATGRNPGC